ncbi:MAG: class I SAM-dependent methyltransferase [Kamptonema sp. SIO4C4]|nr:class I SAM-dependent methyltransferase [Kamptonema sp. SIO4C4]
MKINTLVGLNNYLKPDSQVVKTQNIWVSSIIESAEIQANATFFSHPEWANTYFKACHRDNCFQERWRAVTGSWDDKIVVDIGCGPGNLYATLGGKPKFLLGIDVAYGALKMAKKLGYTILLADAQNLPLQSEFADLVVVNATLHHCADMNKALTEAVRLVKPGGMLVVDHDPQLSAWHYKGLGRLLYDMRLSFIYKFLLRKLHIPDEERQKALATEIHHKPGHGVTTHFFLEVLEPMGFEVKIYPHNNMIGAEAIEGKWGHPPHWRYRVGQCLSGINPFSPAAALSLMCVATRPSRPV